MASMLVVPIAAIDPRSPNKLEKAIWSNNALPNPRKWSRLVKCPISWPKIIINSFSDSAEEKAEDVKEKVQDVKEEVVEKAEAAKEVVVEKAEAAKEVVVEKVEDAKEIVAEKADDLKEKVEDETNRVEEDAD